MAEVEVPNPEELREQANDRFARRVALVTAVIAVVLSIASLGGNNAMKEMLLAQQKSSDQWAFYQAKVIREHLYRVHRMRLEIDLAELGPGLKSETRQRLEAIANKWAEEEKRYGAEKQEIETVAKKLEAERDIHQAKDPYFDYAEVLLQIAIVMCSISIISKSRPPFAFGVALAAVGAFLALNGYTLLVKLPMLGGH